DAAIQPEQFTLLRRMLHQPGVRFRRRRNLEFHFTAGIRVYRLVGKYLSHEFYSVHLRVIEAPRLLEAVLFEHLPERQRGPANSAETGIPAGGAPADMARLQYACHDAVIPGKMISGAHPGISAADDRDVTSIVRRKRRCRQRSTSGSCFPIRLLRYLEAVHVAVINKLAAHSAFRLTCRPVKGGAPWSRAARCTSRSISGTARARAVRSACSTHTDTLPFRPAAMRSRKYRRR